MREAPALVVIDKLLKDGATVRVFDPIAMDECKRRIGDVVTYCKNMYDAADGADVFARVIAVKSEASFSADTSQA